MRQLHAIIYFIRWPALVGALLAIALMLLFPEAFRRPAPPAHGNWSGPVSYAAAVDAASRGVVNIYTRTEVVERVHPFFDDPIFRHFFNSADMPRRKRMQAALGSGVIVSDEGHILTNYHVIADVDEIVVSLEDGRNAHAVVLGEHRERDLAVLKIELSDLHPVPIATHEPKVGDVVLAIGNPFGVGQSVSLGIISATAERNRDLNISTFEDFIQTDAAINPGSSGGALVDAHGRLIGINTANLTQSGSGGIGFAIPSAIALQTLRDVVQFGRVVRGWLGVEAKPVQRLLPENTEASAPAVPSSGVIITNMVRGGPADSAGLLIGDIIVGINGNTVRDARDIMQRIQESRPGETISVECVREGRIVSLRVVLQEQPTA